MAASSLVRLEFKLPDACVRRLSRFVIQALRSARLPLTRTAESASLSCVIGKDFVSAAQVPQLLDGIRGHHMAKAGVENAFWDVEAQHSGMPLSKLLGGTLTEIACGVSVGIQESPNVLVNKVERELRSGYQRIKLKIKPGKD